MSNRFVPRALGAITINGGGGGGSCCVAISNKGTPLGTATTIDCEFGINATFAAGTGTLNCDVGFDGPAGGALPENLRSARTVGQSPIDNTKAGIVNLGSNTGAGSGTTNSYCSLLGGDQCSATGATDTSGFFGQGYATCGGGFVNQANGGSSTVGGGSGNVASDGAATVCGGFNNSATGLASTVVGGAFCVASGEVSVAGGLSATASGQNSVAFGNGVLASGSCSAALNRETEASGENSLAHGKRSIASRQGQRSHSSEIFATNTGAEIPGSAQGCEATQAHLLLGGGFWLLTPAITLEANKIYAFSINVSCANDVADPGRAIGSWQFVATARIDGVTGLAVIDDQSALHSYQNAAATALGWSAATLATDGAQSVCVKVEQGLPDPTKVAHAAARITWVECLYPTGP